MVKVPFVDLAWQHRVIADEVENALTSVMSTGAFILGPEVRAFEEEFAHFSGAPECIGVANGTDALVLALRALSLQPGDEVLVPTNSFIASAEAVLAAGGRPVFVDVREDDYLIDLNDAASAVTERTRVVMPVHLYGRLVDPTAIRTFAETHDLLVVGDAAQAQGATWQGDGVASGTPISGTSFYPGKNLGAYGDAGAVLTADPELASRVRMLRDHGSPAKYVHELIGCNSRLDSMQAAVLRIKLRHLNAWNDMRRRAAANYHELLAGVEGVVRPLLGGEEHVWHLYTVRVDAARRDDLVEQFTAAGIGAGIHYPVPIHRLKPMSDFATRSLPVAERTAHELMSLPIFPGITDDQQEQVVETLRAALASR